MSDRRGEEKTSVAPGFSRSGHPVGPYAKLQRPPAQRCPFGSTGSITGLSYCYLYLVTIPLVRFWVMGRVLKRSLCLVSLGVLCFACGGCASPGPATPSFAAMPGRGKSYEAFQRDDQYCQSSAQQAIGYQSPGDAANQTTVRTAAVGTSRRDRRCRDRFGVGKYGNGCGIGRRHRFGCR